ncbi:hypothetical protein [Mesorhizobium sp.]|uniref:hypothetical protein n=1 Tax=Mesorhizobium sp. TaxID=1871066 RepID=UPI000FE60515|nr:hypothetical protein [Mesorhizobium sp.]RWD70208.1 MAG: hypothetical protein EOS37_15510 [Mesorhizobium sp.]
MFGWLKPKGNVPAAPSDMELMAKAATGIVNAYDDYLEKHPIGLEVRDVSNLPYSKKVILNAILIELASERDARIRQFLIEIGLKLASFREGIGPEELDMVPPGLKVGPETMKLLDDEKLVQAIVDYKGDFGAHLAVFADVLKERKEQIAPLLDKAAQIAAQRA